MVCKPLTRAMDAVPKWRAPPDRKQQMGADPMIARLGVPGLFGMTLGLGLAVLSRSDTPAAAFNPASIRCFSAPAATVPVTRADAQADRKSANPAPDASRVRAAVDPLTKIALESARTCASTRCSASEAVAVTRNVSAYLDARRRITAELYQQHRGPGLAIADHVFANESTQALSKALADLHAQGKIDPMQFGDKRDALALVMTKPAEAFRPCATHASRNLYWYVY